MIFGGKFITELDSFSVGPFEGVSDLSHSTGSVSHGPPMCVLAVRPFRYANKRDNCMSDSFLRRTMQEPAHRTL